MNNRIKQVIESEKISRAEFAKRIEVSQAFVSQICSGVHNPSPRTISAICREFNIRREWLETGEGPMRLPEPEEDLDYINILMEQCDSPFKDLIRAILVSYDRSTPTAQKAITDYIDQILSELDERR